MSRHGNSGPGLPHKKNPPLLRSFACAFSGMGTALLRERNLRVHVAAGVGVLCFARYYPLTRGEWAVLLLTLGLVLSCELFNSALEHLADLCAPGAHPLAKAAKDMAAGAVLVSTIASVGVGLLLFWDPVILGEIAADLAAHPLPALAFLAVALVWIVVPGRLQRRLK